MRVKMMLALVVVLALTGCASSTSPGAIGMSRSQLLIVPSATVNAKAANDYMQLSSEASRRGKLNTNEAMTVRVRGIANKLIPHVGVFREEAVGWNWEVNVIESDMLNAFCMPGGKIGVFSGIIERLSLTDEELAAVIGHEIGHALRDHSREQLSQQTLTDAIVRGIANSGSRYAGSNAQLANLGAKLLLHLPYSREMEYESDVIGVELMARAGYNPDAAASVWEKMQRMSGGGRVDFLSTHPSNEKRIEAIRSSIPKVETLYLAASGQSAKTYARAPSSSVGTLAVAQMSGNAPKASSGQSKAAAPERSPGQAVMMAPRDMGRQEVVAVPSAATALVATSGSGQSTKAAEKYVMGQESYQLERSIRNSECGAAPLASLVEKVPGLERYRATCAAGSVWEFECQMGACMRVK